MYTQNKIKNLERISFSLFFHFTFYDALAHHNDTNPSNHRAQHSHLWMGTPPNLARGELRGGVRANNAVGARFRSAKEGKSRPERTDTTDLVRRYVSECLLIDGKPSWRAESMRDQPSELRSSANWSPTQCFWSSLERTWK